MAAPLTSALGRVTHVNLSKLKVNLVYIVSSKTTRATQRPHLKTKQKTTKQTRN